MSGINIIYNNRIIGSAKGFNRIDNLVLGYYAKYNISLNNVSIEDGIFDGLKMVLCDGDYFSIYSDLSIESGDPSEKTENIVIYENIRFSTTSDPIFIDRKKFKVNNGCVW